VRVPQPLPRVAESLYGKVKQSLECLPEPTSMPGGPNFSPVNPGDTEHQIHRRVTGHARLRGMSKRGSAKVHPYGSDGNYYVGLLRDEANRLDKEWKLS